MATTLKRGWGGTRKWSGKQGSEQHLDDLLTLCSLAIKLLFKSMIKR